MRGNVHNNTGRLSQDKYLDHEKSVVTDSSEAFQVSETGAR